MEGLDIFVRDLKTGLATLVAVWPFEKVEVINDRIGFSDARRYVFKGRIIDAGTLFESVGIHHDGVLYLL